MDYKDILFNEKDLKKIKSIIKASKNPLIFFDDDADGLSSFLLIYRFMECGKGIVIKKHPNVTKEYIRKVEESSPDLIIVLDLAKISDEFLAELKCPVLWIDHHEPQEISRKNIYYFNPRLKGDKECHVPVSCLCYQIVKKDLWIAMAGLVGDWFIEPLKNEFIEKYPKLLPQHIISPPEALFNSDIGKLSAVFNFVLKGNVSDAMKYVKILTRIDSPDEILIGTSSRGKKILKEYEKKYKEYEKLRDIALQNVREDDPILLFNYPSSKNSFTSELSNELLYHYPTKIIIIARENNGEMKCSLRSSGNIFVSEILKYALETVSGYGGGHNYACGASIAKEDFSRFIEIVRDYLKTKSKKP